METVDRNIEVVEVHLVCIAYHLMMDTVDRNIGGRRTRPSSTMPTSTMRMEVTVDTGMRVSERELKGECH